MLTHTPVVESARNGDAGPLESAGPRSGRDEDEKLPNGGSVSLSISVVIPTKNEARNIAWVLTRIQPIVDELIIVDGLSTDGTVDIVRAIRPDAVVVMHPIPGKGEAIRAGFAAAAGDLIVMLDADGSMDPGDIQRFVEQLAAGNDVVKGSRFLPGGGTADMTPLRRLGNDVLRRIANAMLRTHHTDLCFGYMAIRRSRLRELELTSSGFEIETELILEAHRAGLSVVETPTFESPRRFGTSNLNPFRDGWRVLRLISRYRFTSRASARESDTTG
jgi:glycosyltransferase involved in cell wall biosynthesis